jgi:TIR domain
MSGVFICYRRKDTPWSARAIYDRLLSIFGKDNVFFDVVNSDAGYKWKETLANRVGACDALVATIGPNWNPVVDGKRRLDDPDDQVRFELVTAFKRNIPVIPVLVEGATVPSASKDLPEDLKSLFEWQTIDVTETHYDDAIARLTKALSLILEKDTKATVAAPPKPDPPIPKSTPWRGSSLSLIVAAVAGLAVPLLSIWQKLDFTIPGGKPFPPNAAAPSSPPATTPTPSPAPPNAAAPSSPPATTPTPSPAPAAQASSTSDRAPPKIRLTVTGSITSADDTIDSVDMTLPYYNFTFPSLGKIVGFSLTINQTTNGRACATAVLASTPPGADNVPRGTTMSKTPRFVDVFQAGAQVEGTNVLAIFVYPKRCLGYESDPPPQLSQ